MAQSLHQLEVAGFRLGEPDAGVHPQLPGHDPLTDGLLSLQAMGYEYEMYYNIWDTNTKCIITYGIRIRNVL